MRKSNESFNEYKERMIDTVSDSFCAAKWYNSTIWLGHGQTASCHHPPGHWIPMEELETNYTAIHNTKHKKLMRKMMQEGERPQECEYCWKVEDIGRNNISDRVYKTEIFKDEDVKACATTPWDQDVTLRTLEIAFDRACNFACSYCNPAFSSSWVKDIKDNGPYMNIQSDGRGHFIDTAPWAARKTLHEEDNPYIIAFWKWWENGLSDKLEEIRITGGEPLMHKSVWKLFDWFRENPNSTMRFAINSNLVPENERMFQKLIDASFDIQKFEIYTSAECAATQNEYIRDGLNYKVWRNNIIRLLKESNVKKLHCMMTINSLCLETITEFMDDMIELRKEFGQRAPTMTLNILRFPSFQSAAILPVELKAIFKRKLEDWLPTKQEFLNQGEVAHVQRLIDYLDVVKTPHRNTAETPKLYNDFRYFYEQYDIRRNKDFRAAFPTFVEWYNSIPYNSDIVVPSITSAIDPATTENYLNDDIVAGTGGWNTKTDTLGV
jgi:organic radical activating enzyme